MDDLISRKDALEALLDAMCGTGYQTEAIDAIRAVPAIKSGNLRVEMTYEDIISQLKSLKDNSQSFLDKDEPESIWQRDIDALNAAIEIIRNYAVATYRIDRSVSWFSLYSPKKASADFDPRAVSVPHIILYNHNGAIALLL